MSDQLRYMQHEVSRLQDENRALKEEVVSLRQYLNSLQALMTAIDQIAPSDEIMPLLDRILYNALLVINARNGSLLVLDEETRELVFVITHGDVPRQQLVGVRIPPGKGIAGWVVEHRRPTVVNNAASDDRFFPGIDTRFDFQTQSILAAPIIGSGRVLGVIEVLNKQNDAPFNQTDQTLMMLLCRFAGEVLSAIVQRDEPAAAAAPPPA